MANGKNIATKPKAGALATINYAEDANFGLEKMTAQDLAIPFLVLIQKTSPQIEVLEGCKPGMIYNTVTNKLSKEYIKILVDEANTRLQKCKKNIKKLEKLF